MNTKHVLIPLKSGQARNLLDFKSLPSRQSLNPFEIRAGQKLAQEEFERLEVLIPLKSGQARNLEHRHQNREGRLNPFEIRAGQKRF